MADISDPPRADIEYRFNHDIASHTCPLCGNAFESRVGTWPFVAGTRTAVCGGSACPVGDDVTGTSPCDLVFEFVPLRQDTLEAIAVDGREGESVAERLRRVALDESLADPDRAVLQLAAIDLQFCEADGTRIIRIEPTLMLVTCGEAAAELILSGCGNIAGNGTGRPTEPTSDQTRSG